MEKERPVIIRFISNKWVDRILWVLALKLIDYILALKIPAFNVGLLHGLKSFFAIRFSFAVTIPMWVILAFGLIIIFSLVRYIFFKKWKIRVIGGDVPIRKQHHVAGTESAEFFIDKKEAIRLIGLKRAERITGLARYFFQYYHTAKPAKS
jgi:hypothetical protein